MLNAASPIEFRMPTRTVAGSGAALACAAGAGLLAAAGALGGTAGLELAGGFAAGWLEPPLAGPQAIASKVHATAVLSSRTDARRLPIIGPSSFSAGMVPA